MLIYDGYLRIAAYLSAMLSARIREVSMRCDECGTALYEAGDVVPAGVYARVDDGSFRRVTLERAGPLPASFDGHVAEYRTAATTCICERRHAAVVIPASIGSAMLDAPEKESSSSL